MNYSDVLNRLTLPREFAVLGHVWQRVTCRPILFIVARDRRLVFGVVVLFLAAPFALLIVSIHSLLSPQLSNAFTFCALFVFVLLCVWLEPTLRRVLHPEEVVYRQIVEEYGQVVREMSDLGGLLQYVTQTLHETLDAASVSVWLYHAQDHILVLSSFVGTITADDLAELPVDIEPKRLHITRRVSTLPESALRHGLMASGVQVITSMNWGDELIGIIGLGDHRFGKGHSNETVRLLDLMAGQSALPLR